MRSAQIDHLTVTAPTLEAGLKFVQRSLDVSPVFGGCHPKMGTHNLLLSLGDSMFLEVIAIDPRALHPSRPRWFELDSLMPESSPRLAAWVVRVVDIAVVAEQLASLVGPPEPMTRGKLRREITIPSDGRLPMGGAVPALIEWGTPEHPAQTLPPSGCRLLGLTVIHPEPMTVRTALDCIGLQPSSQVIYSRGPSVELEACIETPAGIRRLG
jgi:hypothetical protein